MCVQSNAEARSCSLCCSGKVINQSRYRPGQAQRVLRKLRFPDFVTTAQDGGKVVSLTHRPPLPPGNTPGTHFCLRLSRPQGHSAIEPATFRFVAQHLNHCATAVPSGKVISITYSECAFVTLGIRACKCHRFCALLCCYVHFYSIFVRYLINGTIFCKKKFGKCKLYVS